MIKKITRAALEKFLKSEASEGYMLDIGSGGSMYGYDRFFPHRITVDIDPARNPEIVGDIHALPFGDNTFDRVLCVEVLEHVKDPRRAFKEMKRVLKPGGKIVLSTRFLFPIHDAPNDYWRFTHFALQMLADETGLSVLRLEPDTRALSGLGAVMQRIAFQSRFKYADKLIKILLFVFAWVVDRCAGLTKEEFGDIKKESRVTALAPAGYFLVAKKN
ncbi:MAG: class I SAM-dependent methyltransferase [Patescibacteria group bacterium]